jgi:putative GTP pyrophosphokinase
MPPPYSKSQVDRAGRLFADLLPARAGGQRRVNLPLGQQVLESLAVIDWWRSEHAKPLSRVAANLRYHAAEEGDAVVSQRLKRVPTIIGKLRREPTMRLSTMADIGGVRAILPDQAAAYRVASRLRRNWTITRFRDYVADPKEDGYRAIHLINRSRGRLIEIQLRTSLQDEWANLVETMSRAAFPGMKFGNGPPEVRKLMHDFADLIANVDQDSDLSYEEFARLQELGMKLFNLSQQRDDP